MINNRKIDASVLPVVLVVGSVMLLAVAALLNLSDMENALFHRSVSQRQKEAWLDAAFILYEQDSTLMSRLDDSCGFVLFEEDSLSLVTVEKSYWGLYEIVTAGCDDGRMKRTRLMGMALEGGVHAALYVADNRRALTIAGRSDLSGDIYIPDKGIIYGRVKSDFYSGERLPQHSVHRSAEELPQPDDVALSSLLTLADSAALYSTALDGERAHNSFLAPTSYISESTLQGVSLTGNIVVGSSGTIEVGSSAVLEDVVLTARKIAIEDGFSGSLQAFATDTITVGRNVTLRYPSGLAVPHGTKIGHISIGSGSEVNGYVLFCQREEGKRRLSAANYIQADSSRVRGLVWIDGIAQVQGAVTGSLYAMYPNYDTTEGTYINMFYNLHIYGSQAMAFPVWMAENGYERKTVKWLY